MKRNQGVDMKPPLTEARSGGEPEWSWRIGPTGGRRPTPLSTSTWRQLDRITRRAGESLVVPAVCATLVDREGKLVASCHGLDVPTALLLTYALRSCVLRPPQLLVIADARRDSRMAGSPAVRDGTVRACVGTGLRGWDGLAVGSLWLLDPNDRQWTPNELDFIRTLAAELEAEMAAARFPRPRLVPSHMVATVTGVSGRAHPSVDSAVPGTRPRDTWGATDETRGRENPDER